MCDDKDATDYQAKHPKSNTTIPKLPLDVEPSRPHRRLRKLHTITPYHDYEVIKDNKYYNYGKICRGGRRDGYLGRSIKCDECNRVSCTKCFLINLYWNIPIRDECKDCFMKNE